MFSSLSGEAGAVSRRGWAREKNTHIQQLSWMFCQDINKEQAQKLQQTIALYENSNSRQQPTAAGLSS